MCCYPGTIGYQTPTGSNDYKRSIYIAPLVRVGHRRRTMTAQSDKSLTGITVRRTATRPIATHPIATHPIATHPIATHMMENGKEKQDTGCQKHTPKHRKPRQSLNVICIFWPMHPERILPECKILREKPPLKHR